MARVTSVVRALEVIREIGRSESGTLSLGELGRRLEIPKSTLHNICRTLSEFDVVRQEPGGTYTLGVGVLELGRGYRQRHAMLDDFFRVVPTLPAISPHTTVLAVLDGAEVVYVACRKGSSPIGVDYDVGLRLSASCTATGKALLASMTDDAVRSIYDGRPLPVYTPQSLQSVEALLEDLREIRERGYSVDDEETSPGMRCIGAAVEPSEPSTPSAAVAVSLVKSSVEMPLDEYAESVRELSRRLSKGTSTGG